MNWQPIETAPRSGEFLGYDPVARKFDVCHMVEWRKGRVWCRAVQYDGLYGPCGDDFDGERATHWCELPQPPA